MANLTKRLIDSLTYTRVAPARQTHWDDAVKGFGVRVYPNGEKSYVFSYRHQARKRLIALGRVTELTLDQARDQALSHKLSLRQEDVDPLAQRQRALLGDTVAQLCTAYLERYAKLRKRSWRDDEQRINKYILPAWGPLKAAALKRMDVAAIHRRVGAYHPYAANRIVELISKMFELARVWGIVEEDHPNPGRRIEAFREVKRDRWVTAGEMPRLGAAIQAEPNVYVRGAICMYLLTGARKTELLKARWRDIDWHREEWALPETKNGKPHLLPLSRPAVRLLKSLPREDGNPYIFVGALAGQPLVNISKPWLRIRAAAGIPDVRLHDLRRTVGSMLAQNNHSLHLIGRVLNHQDSASTLVYARFGQNHVRSALEIHGKGLVRSFGRALPAELRPAQRRVRKYA
jgi:integrase